MVGDPPQNATGREQNPPVDATSALVEKREGFEHLHPTTPVLGFVRLRTQWEEKTATWASQETKMGRETSPW